MSRGAGSSSAFPDRPLRARFSEFVTSCTRVVAGTPVRLDGTNGTMDTESEMIHARIRTPSRRRSEHATAGRAQTHTPGRMPTPTQDCVSPHAPCHVSRPRAGPRVRPSRTAALDRRPRRTTPHHVADHSQEQSSPHNHLPTVFAPHETKTQKPGAVTLVIVPQTAGMPHRPL